MLSRSGFSIRKLIAPKRSNAEDEFGVLEQDSEIPISPTSRHSSWMHSKRSARKKGPPEPIVIRHASSFQHIPRQKVLPTSASTSYLSSSYDSHAWSPPNRSHDAPRTPYTPASLPPHTQHVLSPWKQTNIVPPPRSTSASRVPRQPLTARTSHSPMISPPIHLSQSPSPMFRPRRATVQLHRLEGWPEDVRPSVEEGGGEMQRVVHLRAPFSHVPLGPMSADMTKALPPLPLSLRKYKTPEPRAVLRKARPKAKHSLPALTPSRSSSVSKRKKRGRKSSTPKQAGRRTLTENVSDTLSRQLFRKLEADDMLTPRQTLRDSRSVESFRSTASSDGSVTPLEPFHLDDLPARIQTAGVKTDISPLDDHVSTILSQQALPHSFRNRGTQEHLTKNVSPIAVPYPLKPLRIKARNPEDDISDIGATQVQNSNRTVKTDVPPVPPPKNPNRFLRRPSDADAARPTPEVFVTSPENKRQRAKVKRATKGKKATKRNTLLPREDSEFIYLASSPYSLTAPGFRHGPIRFSKADLGMKSALEGSVDWTMFQTAILGGAGDFFSGSHEFSQRREELEEREDLCSWFDEFHFETAGRLVGAGEGMDRHENDDDDDDDELFSTPHNTPELSPASSLSSGDLPISVELEHPNGFWNEGDCDTSKFVHEGCAIRRWTVEGHPKPYRRDRADSSCILPAEREGSCEGCNLGGDFAGFLKWEEELLCAAAQYGGQKEAASCPSD